MFLEKGDLEERVQRIQNFSFLKPFFNCKESLLQELVFNQLSCLFLTSVSSDFVCHKTLKFVVNAAMDEPRCFFNAIDILILIIKQDTAYLECVLREQLVSFLFIELLEGKDREKKEAILKFFMFAIQIHPQSVRILSAHNFAQTLLEYLSQGNSDHFLGIQTLHLFLLRSEGSE